MKNLLLLILLLIAIGCGRSSSDNEESVQDKLPEATQTGANTAGCYINGKLLIPKNGSQAIGGSPAYGLTTGAGNNFHPPTIGNDYEYFRIANLKDNDGNEIYLHLNNMSQGLGEYIVGQSNGEYFPINNNVPHIIAHIRDSNNLIHTYYSSDNSGKIIIKKFDYYEGIYSGTFSATLYNKDNPSEKTQITDGRFDVNIGTLNH